jgi:histidyl-tRNA synthetase
MVIQSIKGFNDILPPESAKWYFIEHTARDVFETYGFKEIRVPILEKTMLFARSIGESTDIVEKEMYSFIDRGHEQVTLRPEGTAPVVRAFIQHKLYSKPGLVKFYYFGPMFRHERPQAGRYRQFYQIGVEAFGVAAPALDGEIIIMLMELFSKLGLKNIHLQLNSLGCADCRPGFKASLANFLETRKDQLCQNCQARLSRNPIRVLDCKNEDCQTHIWAAPSLDNFLCSSCRNHFQEVQNLLATTKIAYQINTHLVRGLDYYTRTTFEIIAPGLGAQNALAGGGRYDSLVEELGGPPTPAIGFAMGVERLALLMDNTGLPIRLPKPQIFIASLGKEAERLAFQILYQLRQEGIRVEKDYDNPSLKSQLRKANRLEAAWVIILGEDELHTGKAIVKNMTTGHQTHLSLTDLVAEIKEIIF